MENVVELIKALPSALLLFVLLVAIPVYLFLSASPQQTIPAVIVGVLGLLVGSAIYLKDKERQRAEGATAELRRLLELTPPEGAKQRDAWTRPMLQHPLPPNIREKLHPIFGEAIEVARQELGRFCPASVESGRSRCLG